MTEQKRHAPPAAIALEVQRAIFDALKDHPVSVQLLAANAVDLGLRAANAKNDAGEAGYV